MAVQKKQKIDLNDYTKGGTAPATGTRVNPTAGSGSLVSPYHTAFASGAQAMNGQDVAGQDPLTRAWQMYSTAGEQQKKASDKRYAENYAAADNQAMSRGMGRSSFNNQTLANINQQKSEAAAQIDANTVASFQQFANDYQQQLQQQQHSKAEFEANQQAQNQNAAMQWIGQILQSGGSASDELLAQAGLSRADFNAMKKQQATGGGGGYRPRTDGTEDDDDGKKSYEDRIYGYSFADHINTTAPANWGNTSTGNGFFSQMNKKKKNGVSLQHTIGVAGK